MKPRTPEKSRRQIETATLSQRDWLKAGLEALRTEGIEGVRIERLARTLGVTKGSFYWHFKDRQDLLTGMLQYWDEQFTRVAMEGSPGDKADPRGRLKQLVLTIEEKQLNRYDPAVRSWAAHNVQAAACVRTVDQSRQDYVRSLLANLGFRGEALELRTHVFVVYHSWKQTIDKQSLKRGRREDLLDLEIELFAS